MAAGLCDAGHTSGRLREPVRPCLHRGCPNLTEVSWCAQHAPERRVSHDRGAGTTAASAERGRPLRPTTYATAAMGADGETARGRDFVLNPCPVTKPPLHAEWKRGRGRGENRPLRGILRSG